MNRYILYDLGSVHNLKARIVTAFMTVLFASPAFSQDISEACERVAMFEFGISEVHSRDVQSFPELHPPRVRMRIRGEGVSHDTVTDALARVLGQPVPERATLHDFGLVSCQFERSEPPFGLIAFECSGWSCSISDIRLEELQVLLYRDYGNADSDPPFWPQESAMSSDEIGSTPDVQDILGELRADNASLKSALAEAGEVARQDVRRMELMNQQISALRGQVGGLRELNERLRTENERAQAEIDNMKSRLNAEPPD